MLFYYKPIYQSHYQDPRDPYLWRIDRHDPNLTHHTPRGFNSGIRAFLDTNECTGSSAFEQAEASALKSSLSLPPQAPPYKPSNRPQEVVIGPHSERPVLLG